MLDWTQAELADRAGVSRSTIRDFEGGRHELHRATETQLRHAFEEKGVRMASDARGMHISLGNADASDPLAPAEPS
jgi:transcriptional regulator with XRE-family HTH domain